MCVSMYGWMDGCVYVCIGAYIYTHKNFLTHLGKQQGSATM